MSNLKNICFSLKVLLNLVCEYLREFTESMEGTREGMTLALPIPECDADGNYLPTQCEPQSNECWCADNFGTEIPKSRLEFHFYCNQGKSS